MARLTISIIKTQEIEVRNRCACSHVVQYMIFRCTIFTWDAEKTKVKGEEKKRSRCFGGLWVFVLVWKKKAQDKDQRSKSNLSKPKIRAAQLQQTTRLPSQRQSQTQQGETAASLWGRVTGLRYLHLSISGKQTRMRRQSGAENASLITKRCLFYTHFLPA